MIMAHAPVILPVVVRRPLPYIWPMYALVVLLHLSLLLRLAVGDARACTGPQVGGVLNIVGGCLIHRRRRLFRDARIPSVSA